MNYGSDTAVNYWFSICSSKCFSTTQTINIPLPLSPKWNTVSLTKSNDLIYILSERENPTKPNQTKQSQFREKSPLWPANLRHFQLNEMEIRLDLNQIKQNEPIFGP